MTESGVPPSIGAIHAASQRLRIVCLVFAGIFLALIALLLDHVQDRIAGEELLRDQAIAQRLADGIENEFYAFIANENIRSFGDYGFFNINKNPLVNARSLAFSPLSQLKREDTPPGLIGYFQYDQSGELSSPILPRVDIETLSQNDLLLGTPEIESRLMLWKDLQVAMSTFNVKPFSGQAESPGPLSAPEQRLEQVELPGSQLLQMNVLQRGVAEEQISPDLLSGDQLQTFTAVIESLRPTRISSTNIAFVRRAYNDNEHFTQGLALNTAEFFRGMIRSAIGEVLAGSGVTVHAIAFDSHFNPSADTNTSTNIHPATKRLILSLRFRAPFNPIEFRFFSPKRTVGPGSDIVTRLILLLAAVLITGVYGMYYLGKSHLALAKERNNFVSAVSHELKTPLTSIRMYGEMLKKGWIREEGKREEYYDRIYSESERLSGLVENILLLSRLGNRKAKFEFEEIPLTELLDDLDNVLRARIKEAGFSLVIQPPNESDTSAVTLLVDRSAFMQIFLNLTDNSLKFSADAEKKEILIGVDVSETQLKFSLRDFGPGVSVEQEKKIFELFYRGEDELTRSTPGTGIGLAIVEQLARELGAAVSLTRQDPGVQVQLLFGLLEGLPADDTDTLPK